MAVRAVFFDVGGVLEITPSTGWTERWETRLGLPPGGLTASAGEVFAAGSVGALDEAGVTDALAATLSVGVDTVDALLADMWEEYLGVPNAALLGYVATLRGRCAVGIISNSFVGAREREQRRYRFEDLTDHIAYSHEVGVLKPDAAIYLDACRAVGVAPDEAALVDDWGPAVAGARDVGMHAILYTGVDHAVAAVEQLLSDG